MASEHGSEEGERLLNEYEVSFWGDTKVLDP